MKESITVNGKNYRIIRLLGHGKGGYSYLADCEGTPVVVKQIHHEPCGYYTFGNKIEAERHDYERLKQAGIRIPEMLDIDTEAECIVKAYIEGPTIAELLASGVSVEEYLPQVRAMAGLAEAAGLNIDYYPTNFAVSGGLLWYVDYECNDYSEQWDFEHWGVGHWLPAAEFQPYQEADYEAVCQFLIALNRGDQRHINWNWARFEWMMEHPEFDKSTMHAIGLWRVKDRVVGAAIYDMYFGEAFCAVLPGFEKVYPEILDYAWRELKDENGLGIAVCDKNKAEIAALKAAGFVPADQTESVMAAELDRSFDAPLPEGYSLMEVDPVRDQEALQWLFWQGFDHGEDREEFERQEQPVTGMRPHFRADLSLAAVAPDGEMAALAGLWFHDDTDYAYVEPVCTVPAHRGEGLAKALLYEAMKRAGALGAKKAYVISDMDFYRKLGFEPFLQYRFYWKTEN